MRSRTLSTLPGRCRRCYQRSEHCLCALIPTVATRTRFVVIRHYKEAPKSTGTARVAALAMPSMELRPFGERDHLFDGADLAAPGTALLFPGDAPLQVAPSPPPCRVVVLDGTWHQARTMFKKIPELHALPRLHLRPTKAPAVRLREPHFGDGMSTLEAVARAVALLEGETLAEPLDRLHVLWIERCLRTRGLRIPEELQRAAGT